MSFPEKDYTILLRDAVTLLKNNGIKKIEVAKNIGFTKKDNQPDHVALTKLCNGLLLSYKKRSPEKVYKDITQHKLYASYFSDTTLNTISFDVVFAFYYWSYQNKLKTAIIGINYKRPSAGRLVYLEKQSQGGFKEKYSHPVLTQEYKNAETLDLRFNSREKKSGSTFLSIHLGNRSLEDINLTFASFAGAMSTDQNQYCGVGVIQKVNKTKLDAFLEDLYENDAPPSIYNMLYRKRFDMSWPRHDMYEHLEELWENQREPLRLLKGFWTGYYLRRLIDGPGEDGGIVKVIMEIKESGEAAIYFNEFDSGEDISLVTYSGFFRFPGENSYQITVGEFQRLKKVNRLSLLLKPRPKKMVGIFTGWRSLDLGYFTSPIYFDRIPEEKILKSKNTSSLLNSLIKELKPRMYHRSEINSSKKDEFKEVLSEFNKIEQGMFETLDTCLGVSKK